MTNITTVLGPRAADALGKTLIHEHVIIGFPGWYLDNRWPKYERGEAMARAVDAFERIKDFGVQSFVDPCPNDLGRDVEFSAELAQKTGVNIVCSTGLYYEAAGIPYLMRGLEEAELTEIFLKEIEDGVGDTGIKPGVVKVATGDGVVSDYERKVVTAAARAAHHAGLPVMSHTENCTCGHDQIDIVTGAGIAPDRFIVGHSDGADALDYQASLAERGVFVGFDRFGIELFAPDAVRVKNFKALADKGYVRQLMMSQDYVTVAKGGLPGVPPGTKVEDILPNWGLTHIFERIIPQLKAEGMTDADFETILVENPRRFLAGA